MGGRVRREVGLGRSFTVPDSSTLRMRAGNNEVIDHFEFHGSF